MLKRVFLGSHAASWVETWYVITPIYKLHIPILGPNKHPNLGPNNMS